jgi:HYR domain
MKTPTLCTRRAARLALLGLCLAGFARPAAAEPRSSAHYSQATESLNGGGSSASSPAYSNGGGISMVGAESSSTTYAEDSGFPAAAQDSGPTLTLPGAPVLVEAAGPNGTMVTFTPTASDQEDGPLVATTTPPSGSFFAIGDTLVIVNAADLAGHPAIGSFVVRVRDTTAPVLTVPPNSVVHATSPAGAEVAFMPEANDAVGVTSLLSVPPSGSTFPNGTTTVTVTGKDAANNTRTAQFDVTVTPLTNSEDWRYANFGFADNAGIAADTADPDGDGKSNLMEFAFATDPRSGAFGSASLGYAGTFAGGETLVVPGQPIVRSEAVGNGIDFRALFTRRKDYVATGLTYTVQFSANLATWAPSSVAPRVLADDGAAQIVSVPYPFFVGGKKARFFRVVVSIAP